MQVYLEFRKQSVIFPEDVVGKCSVCPTRITMEAAQSRSMLTVAGRRGTFSSKRRTTNSYICVVVRMIW